MAEQLTQALSLLDKIDPANYAANTYLSAGMDVSKVARALYEVSIGVITGAATIDANLQSAAAANFATPHNITSANITQITSTNNSNTRFTIEVRADQVNQLNQGDRYVRLRVVLGTNAAFLSASGWGGEPHHKPATQHNLNSAVLLQQVVTP